MTEERLCQQDVGCRLLFPKEMQNPSGTLGTEGSAFWLNTEEEKKQDESPSGKSRRNPAEK